MAPDRCTAGQVAGRAVLPVITPLLTHRRLPAYAFLEVFHSDGC